MEKICKNCKYYKANDISFRNRHYGECRNEEKLQYDYSTAETTEYDKLFYQDSESYQALLEVGEEFGCIHWKESE